MDRTGWSEKTLYLSQTSPGLAEEHGLDEIVVSLNRYRDGIVENMPINEHLAGSIVFTHRRKTKHTNKTYNEFVPIDNAFPQADNVEEQMNAEADRIGGRREADGLWTPGEVDGLVENRTQLFDWLTLPDEEKADIWDYFGAVAGVRARAVNPLNVDLQVRAERALELTKNPRAVMAITHAMEDDFDDRFVELSKNLGIAHARRQSLKAWIFDENRHLASANNVMNRLIAGDRGYDMYTLVGVTNLLCFRVQPFNMVGYFHRQTGGHELDPAWLEQAQQGLRFHRLNNYLLLPFRKLTSGSMADLGANLSTDRNILLPRIDERLEALESQGIAEGPYHRLIGRLLLAAGEVKTAFHKSDAPTVREAAEDFKSLVHYLCLPGNDPEAKIWYGQKLC